MKTPHSNWTYISLFVLIISIFPKLMSAQTVEISPNLNNEKILFGTEITATEVENAQEYMFLIYSQDSSFSKTITKSVNYLTHLDYQGLPRFYFLNYRVKALVNNVWTEYSQATRINIILDCAFDEMYMERVFTPDQVALIDNQINELKSSAMQKDLSDLEEITIPIVFHVMVPSNQSELEFLTPSKISQAVDILNQLYAGEFANNEIDTKIRFCLAPEYYDGVEDISLSVPYAGQVYNGITYHNHDGTGINLPNNSDLPYISNSENVNSANNLNAYYSVFPTDDFLNIFIFDELYDSNIYGFAWSAAHPIGAETNGFVVIGRDVVGHNNIPNREFGFTLGHEIGHYFGLWHTWTTGAATESECTEDDEIDDTAPHRFPNFTCDENSDQCPDDILNDPIHNVMNYTPDGCRNQFTELQASYMRSVIDDVYSTLNNPLPYNETEDLSHCVTVPDIEDIAIISPTTGGFCSGLNNITIFPDDAESFVLNIYKNNQHVITLSEANFDTNWETTFNFNEDSHYTLVLDATMGDATHTVEQEYDVFECGEIDYTYAQWHFDHGVSLDFTSGYAQLGDTEIEADKCETSACDDSGNLLFYTNGHDIWNHNHNITNISINDAAGKGKGIIPLKLEETENYAIYSLIYLNNINTLSYLTITINKSNYSITENDSGVLISSTDFTGLGISNPEMVSLTAVEKINSNEYQVISCIKYNSETNYYPIAIDIQGSIPTSFDSNNCNISPIDINMGLSDATNVYDQTVKASPDAKFIVYSNPGSETFLFNFNTETGEFLEISNCGFLAGVKNSVTAFSPNSQFLYYYNINIANHMHTIFQVNLEDINLCDGCDLLSIPIYERDIDESNYLLSTYFLQEGPDGKIYFSRHSEFDANAKYIGVISQPNNNAASISGPNPCGVIDDYIHYTPGSGLINKFYLPNFVDGNADPCNLDFKLCSEDCGGEVQILNLSHGLAGEFTWVVNNGTNTIPTDGTSFAVSGDGVYTVTLSKIGCDPESDSITINSAPASASIIGAEEICLGSSSNYLLDFSTSENATWYVDGVAQSEESSVFTLDTDGYAVDDEINLSVDAISNSGCDVHGELLVTVTGFSHQIITSDYCNETSPGQIDVQVGDETVFPVDFIYEANDPQTLTETTGNYFDLLPGLYSYTISDGNSCSNTEEFEIQPSFDVGYEYHRIICRAYEVTLNPTLTSGSFIFETYIDGNLVELSPSFTIGSEEENNIVYPIQDLPYGNTIYATETTTGCVAEFQIDIPALPDVELISSIVHPYFCDDHQGSVELFLTGDFFIDETTAMDYDYTYELIDNGNYDLDNGWLFTFNNLEAGNHSFSFYDIADNEQCTTSFPFTIEASDIANVTSTITPSCSSTSSGSVVLTIDFAETLMPSGQVEWSNEPNTDYTLLTDNTYETSLNNLDVGTYYYTITSDVGCDLSGEIFIPVSTFGNILDEDVEFCGSPYPITISSQPFTEYLWNTGETEREIEITEDGTYSITVTNEYGCTAQDEINIISFPEVNSSIVSAHVSCYDESNGSATVTATGGDGNFTYLWSEGQTTPTATNLSSGNYSVTVTDGNLCESISTVEIVENPEIFISITDQTSEICEDNCTAFATIEASGGYGDYSYLWNDPAEQTTPTATQLCGGSYSITVTDDNGCSLNQSVNISELSAPTVYAGQDEIICGEFKGNIGNAATGGNPPYTYNWSPVDFITPPTTPADYNPYIVLSSLGSNIFTVTVTDINGCTTSDDITITILESPNVSLSATDELICLGESTEISAEITGGVDPLEIDWSHDSGLHSNTAIVSPTEWTGYTVSVTGANGCSETQTINIDVENISIYSDVNYQYGNNYASVDFSFYPDISTTNYSFTLVDENNNPYTNFNALPTGHTYTATLVSENGCTYTDVFDLIFIDSYSTSIIEVNPITCIPEPNGSITIQIEGGLAPYEVNIYNPENINISSLTVNEQGTYTFELTDLQPTGEDEFTVQISDANGNLQGLSTSINFAWNANGIILTSGNIGTQELFTNKTIQLGNQSDQSLNISHNITFKDCIIYTNTYGTDEEETVWTVNKPYDLILDNTTVQSGCPDNMWQGIEAQGQHGEHTTDVQSLVMLKNESSIADAICAIKSINGAIIQTYSSSYLNNQYDLYFTHYCSSHSATKINNNVFETSRQLNKDGLYPKSHVYMTYVRGIDFKNNIFRNSTPLNSKEYHYINQRGIGISSYFSSYDVTPVSGINYTLADFPNKFEGLFYGVRARSSYGTPVRVHHSKFTNNFRGIYMSDNNSARVLFNTFETSTATPLFQWYGHSLNGTPDNDESYAVYLNACENFFLEDNTAKNGDAGFYVYNTGSTAGEFYNNNFGGAPESGETYNMKAGAIAVGRNSDYIENSTLDIGLTGLQIRCNTFDATGKAIGVVNGNIRRNQGTSSGDNKDLAGNQFSETLVNGMDFTAQIQDNNSHDFSHLNLGIYNYYQHDDSQSENNGYFRELSEYNSIIPQTEAGKYFESRTSCPSHYKYPFIDIDNVIHALSAIRSDKDDYNNLLDEYHQIVDKGNTEYLKATAVLMDNENYANAYEILRNEGYLTDTVLTAILCNNIAPESALVAILIENSPLPEKVIDLVNHIELDANLKNLLMIYQDGVSNRVKLEYAMGDVLQRIANNESKIINIAHNNDSLVSVSDSVLQYLKPLALDDYKYSMQKYKLLVSKQDLRTAKIELAHLNDLAKDMNDSIGYELDKFITIEHIQLAYLDKMDTTIIAKNKNYLEEMATMESDMYSGKAQNLLSLIGEYPYFEYTPMPEDISNPRSTVNQASIEDMFKPTLHIYPNPTKGILTIEYNFEIMQKEGMDLLMQVLGYTVKAHCKNGEVNIYTTGGRLLQTIPLNKLKGNKTIDLSAYPAGNYIIELKDCYENNNSIIITKQ